MVFFLSELYCFPFVSFVNNSQHARMFPFMQGNILDLMCNIHHAYAEDFPTRLFINVYLCLLALLKNLFRLQQLLI